MEHARLKHKIPALAACLVIGDKVVAASAVGYRKVGDPTPVTQSDRFCIGSVTKPMTSTLVGALVEKGVLTFDTTMEKMFPELIQEMQPAYCKVTVRMLLSHTSGMSEPKKSESKKLTPDDLDKTMANRYQYVCNMIVQPPEAAPGTKTIYCSSCILSPSPADALIERADGKQSRITGSSWPGDGSITRGGPEKARHYGQAAAMLMGSPVSEKKT